MTDPRIAKVLAARDAARAAVDDAIALFHSTFPVGSSLSWERGGYTMHGFVVDHLYGDKLLVKNEATRTVYKISHGDVYRAYE